jgi:arylformamidase
MNFYDISRELSPGAATWPGDTPTQIEPTASIQEGASVNVSCLICSTHSSTHVDAPLHFDDSAPSIEQLALEPFWGTAQVVTIDKKAGELFPADLGEADLRLAKRIILHTACSHIDSSEFPKRIAYPGPEFVEYLTAAEICLFGTDAPSVDALDDRELAGHKALLACGISILEGVSLKGVPDGIYELSALPIKIPGADGAPCRAVLRET